MMTNSSPWDNLKFDVEGVEEVRRKFFGTLYNTYSFFAFYANVDGFTPAEKEIPLSERPEIDRRSEEHTSELQSHAYLVCRLLLEKKKPHGEIGRAHV